ncbi:hypothetical protein EVAR_523_1 [Eumeta japonica]|uniref:Uncharacterized protein n=1 Tax=Eumeta variegata TaxID=151549 RepID=A0A4C1SCX9_EUMVA|nr:hypothetical protein EVAR_523_1 [Eumeta japonica]
MCDVSDRILSFEFFYEFEGELGGARRREASASSRRNPVSEPYKKLLVNTTVRSSSSSLDVHLRAVRSNTQ